MIWKNSEANYPCECEALILAAEDPDNPIVFDDKFREYQITYRTNDGPAHMIVCYCPFCGGKTPGSIRNRFFVRISDEELYRLRRMTKEIKTFDDAKKALGPPDAESVLTVRKPEGSGKPSSTEEFPCWIYHNLSETAKVRIYEYFQDRVKIRFEGKYLGEPR